MDFKGPAGAQLSKLMSATWMRSRVLAANVANQNTPGYVRRDVRFEEALLKELRGPRPDVDRLEPEVIEDRDAPRGADGNSVDMEAEVSAARENRLMYELYATISQGRSNLVKMAIREGR